MSRPTPRSLSLFLFVALCASVPVSADQDGGAAVQPQDRDDPQPADLPSAVGAWTRADAPTRIQADALFDYMNGAGELYLAYGFKHLDVHTYRAEGQPDIMVELYTMGGADDTWGLQSEDWTGEAVTLDALTAESRLALYGAGLLRVACGPRYARILAYDETEASREAVLDLGHAVIGDCAAGPPPQVAGALPRKVTHGAGELHLRHDRVRFFRSHLVLNAVYFLTSDDTLGLQGTADAVYAEYRPPGGDHTTRIHALLVHYPDATRARAALESFAGVYLEAPDAAVVSPGTRQVEDAWIGYSLTGEVLAMVFEAPDAPTAEALVRAMTGSTKKGPNDE